MRTSAYVTFSAVYVSADYEETEGERELPFYTRKSGLPCIVGSEI